MLNVPIDFNRCPDKTGARIRKPVISRHEGDGSWAQAEVRPDQHQNEYRGGSELLGDEAGYPGTYKKGIKIY